MESVIAAALLLGVTGLAIMLALLIGIVGIMVAMVIRANRQTALLETLLTSFNSPVLYYDRSGTLIYQNELAREVFSAIPDQIGQFSFIESSAKADGPDFYLSDRFGNGYRLEISRGRATSRHDGRVVLVKGYARGRI